MEKRLEGTFGLSARIEVKAYPCASFLLIFVVVGVAFWDWWSNRLRLFGSGILLPPYP